MPIQFGNVIGSAYQAAESAIKVQTSAVRTESSDGRTAAVKTSAASAVRTPTEPEDQYIPSVIPGASGDDSDFNLKLPGVKGEDEDGLGAYDSKSDSARLPGAPESGSTFSVEKATEKAQQLASQLLGTSDDEDDRTKKAEEEDPAKQKQLEERGRAVYNLSEEDRAALVKALRAEQLQKMQQFAEMIRNSIGTQANAATKANAQAMMNGDGIWKFIASGNYVVDAQTKAEAQEAISEDGYYGVKNTSERIFTMALALSGGDEAKMKDLEKAVEKGFGDAADIWGKEMPGITGDTHDAVSKLFKDYYDSLHKTSDDGNTEDKADSTDSAKIIGTGKAAADDDKQG